MNEFQKTIGNGLGVAVPGTIVEAAESYKLVEHFVTEDDKCFVGGFVRKGSKDGYVTGATGAGDIIGIIIKDQYFSGYELGMSIPQNVTVTVLMFGVIAVSNTYSASATFMDDVYVKDADGTLIFNNTGSADGATKTHWKVKQGADANGIVFVTR